MAESASDEEQPSTGGKFLRPSPATDPAAASDDGDNCQEMPGELLRTVIDGLESSVAVVDRAGRILLVNEAWRSFAWANGEAPETVEGVGQDYFAICARYLPAPFAQQALDGMRAILAGKQGRFALEYPWPSPTGPRWMVINASALAGEPPRLLVTRQEITERVRTLADLRESESRYRTTFNTSPDAIVITRLSDGVILDANEGCQRITGWQREEMIGHSTPGLGAWRWPKDRERMVSALREKGLCENLEAEFVMRSGELRTGLMSARVIFLNGEQCILSVIRDISSRKALEERLRQLSSAVEQSPQSIAITDRDAAIEYVNDALTDASGYSRVELIGRNPRMLNSGKTPKENYRALWSALAAGQSWKGEFINRRKDGSEYTALAIVSPIRDERGSVTHYIAIEEDVTEKKRLSEELALHRHHLEALVEERTQALAQARGRAEAANVAKSAFLANMSHEIRTPMSAIIGLTHLLQRRGGLDGEQADKLAKIAAAGEHLLSVINNILDLSKIEAGKLALEIVEFDLSAMYENLRVLIVERVLAKGLHFRIETEPMPAAVRGDVTRLTQALLNYLSNAVKFTQQGEVTLRARLLEADGGDLLVRFDVEDTGIGIAPEAVSRLFKSFEQGDSSTSRRFGGTGLGLAINAHLAQLMGGEVGAQARSGGGSIFWLTARLGKAGESADADPGGQARTMTAEQSLRDQYRGARILVAEDAEINRMVAGQLLEDAGLAVDFAHDGAEAVEKLAIPGRYDLILMDVQMPGMDGLEAARRIRQLPHGATIPILAITANAFAEDRQICLDAGMSDHVGKPASPERLYETILRWLSKGGGS